MTTGELARYWLPAEAHFPVDRVRRDFPALKRRVNGRPLVWLDNGATTHKPACVIDAVRDYYARYNSNVHRGAHALAREATEAYEEARRSVQRFLGAGSPDEIVFVRGATEAINLVAQTHGRASLRAGDEIVLLGYEHHANIVPWQQLRDERGCVLRVAPLDDSGAVPLEGYADLLGPRTKLVALGHVSNVLGTVAPIAAMAGLAHRHGALVLVDGAQAVPHLRVDVRELGADFYVFSGHKLFAPTGIGALYARRELLERMPPWQGGGSMIKDVTFERTVYAGPPQKFEAGTGHIAGAVGLRAALDYLTAIGFPAALAYEEGLYGYAERALAGVPRLRRIGQAPERVGALTFTLDGTDPQEVARHLDREGIAVRAGHHCAQPALRRYGLEAALRASLAFYNTRADIDALVTALRRCH